MEIYPDKPLGNVLQIAMPRAPRLYALGERCTWWRGVITMGDGTLVPRQFAMETVGILQGKRFGRLFQNRRPLLLCFVLDMMYLNASSTSFRFDDNQTSNQPGIESDTQKAACRLVSCLTAVRERAMKRDLNLVRKMLLAIRKG